MAWIVAALADSAELPEDAVSDFKDVAKANPAAPWRLETGHLRGGRDFLEEMTGRSWEEVDMTADEVKSLFETLQADERATSRPGLSSAVIAFLGVCAKHGFGLEGGVSARRMR